MLTRKQYDLLLFIDQRLKAAGVPPSFDEMKDALGLKSKSGIHRLIMGLEERGFIRRLPHRARALEVTRLPENFAEAAAQVAAAQVAADESAEAPAPTAAPAPPPAPETAAPRFTPNVIRGSFKAALPGARIGDVVGAVGLPLYGKIAAGTPIEALRDNSATMDVPASLLSSSSEHYALTVEGDSMIDAGIFDGDTVIIQRCETAENGAIVVALVDDGEVTLKRLRRKGASIALEPANNKYETRIFGPDRVQVQGKLVALMRRY